MFKQRILVTVVILTVTIRKMFNVCLWFLFPQVCLVILYLDEDFCFKHILSTEKSGGETWI